MKKFSFWSGFLGLGALATWLVVQAFAGQIPLPGSGNGPGLGDPLANIYTIIEGYTMGRGVAVSSSLSVSQSSGQSNCTQLSQQPSYLVAYVGTSSSTGYVCLPTAFSGRVQVIWMNLAQTLDIYSSAVSFTPGTTDTINTTAGSTPYTANTGKKMTICYAVQNGAWACGTIS